MGVGPLTRTREHVYVEDTDMYNYPAIRALTAIESLNACHSLGTLHSCLGLSHTCIILYQPAVYGRMLLEVLYHCYCVRDHTCDWGSVFVTWLMGI